MEVLIQVFQSTSFPLVCFKWFCFFCPTWKMKLCGAYSGTPVHVCLSVCLSVLLSVRLLLSVLVRTITSL